MLTAEQIKKLKPGDELIHTVYFKSVDDNGYIHCDFDPKYSRFVNTFAVDPGVLSLPEENTTLFFPSSIFKNITPNEKQQLASFFYAYHVDKRKKNKLRCLLKKIGIDIMKAPCGPDRTFCHTVDNAVKPKHNTCRSFKKGDKVRVDADLNEEVLTVAANQLNSSVTAMAKDGQVIVMPCYFLKLITPVEEQEPYKVWDTTFSFNVGVEDTKAVFYYGTDMSTCPYTKEQAKSAAEAECDRLNAEWRKEHEND